MSLSKSIKFDTNYLACVVRLGKPIAHPNADKLTGFVINGNRVWVSNDYKEGEIGVYFPLECKINSTLLFKLNLFRDSTLNEDKEAKGYFEANCRVKAIKLRGEPSEGIFLRFDSLKETLGPIENIESFINTEFDLWNNIRICEKYIPVDNERKNRIPSMPRQKGKTESRLIEGQFNLHSDTPKLTNNLHKIHPESIISITNKLHGTSFVVSRCLVKKPLTRWEKFLKFLGSKNVKTEYDTIYSSRTVIKNEFVEKVHKHFYGVDLWKEVKDLLKNNLIEGISLYGEVVGYTSTGSPIQKDYDYGCVKPTDKWVHGENFKIFIYRITYTNPTGHVFEASWQNIKDYCNKYGLLHVPEHYYGRADHFIGKLYNDAPIEDFFTDLTSKIKDLYLEKDCPYCTKKVPSEGVVLKVDNLFSKESYKMKSFRFLEKETKALDLGEVDIETSESL